MPSSAPADTRVTIAAEPKRLKLKLYTPHPGQWRLHQSTARFRVATAGRRFGKTISCLNEVARFAWEHPGSVTWWVAPFFRQTKRAFRMLKRRFRAAFAGKPSESELRVEWLNGSVTEFLSADNYDSLRGEGVDFLVVDEAAKVQRAAWDEALRPTLSDKGGRAIFISTPMGRNWFYELWARGQDRAAWPEYESWQLSTSDNPYIPASEIAEAKRSLPADVFRQEYEAQFLEDSAGVFRGIRACEQGELAGPEPGHSYVLGWDPARHQDASVVYVMDAATKHVVARDRFLETAYSLQRARVEWLAREYNAHILMDSTGAGDPQFEALVERGLDVEGYVFNNTSKQQLVEHLAVLIEAGEVSWPADPVLRHELEVFQYEITRGGKIKYGAPSGMHDDCVIALALAAWAAGHAGGFMQMVREDLAKARAPKEEQG